MFRSFRCLTRRHPAQAIPPVTESEQDSYDRAWADYVQWSGLDEDNLNNQRRDTEDS